MCTHLFRACVSRLSEQRSQEHKTTGPYHRRDSMHAISYRWLRLYFLRFVDVIFFASRTFADREAWFSFFSFVVPSPLRKIVFASMQPRKHVVIQVYTCNGNMRRYRGERQHRHKIVSPARFWRSNRGSLYTGTQMLRLTRRWMKYSTFFFFF